MKQTVVTPEYASYVVTPVYTGSRKREATMSRRVSGKQGDCDPPLFLISACWSCRMTI